jgi:hypothetical protein
MPEVRPHTVEGFNGALARGLIPQVPRQPPSPLSGITAGQAARWFLVKALAVVAVDLVLLVVIPHIGLPRVTWNVLILLAGLGTLWLCYRLWGQVGARNMRELARGYTTLVMPFGAFSWGELRRWEGVGRRPVSASGAGRLLLIRSRVTTRH